MSVDAPPADLAVEPALSGRGPVALQLDDPISFEGFRAAAKRLLAAEVAPERVVWNGAAGAAGESRSLWAESPVAPAARDVGQAHDRAARPSVPASFLPLCRAVLLHRDPQRHALLYRLLWRLQHEPALRDDPLDADWLQAQRMERAVRRDIHKMRAFVRFTKVDATRHVAWFEPEHHIVEANAPFFQRRFAQMHWAILTPERSVEWDGRTLVYGPGGDRSLKPAPDAGEALWLTYYRHIFNPARLNLRAMTREMPRRYWQHLPEAALISPLADAALERSQQMIESDPTHPRAAKRLQGPATRATAVAAVSSADTTGAGAAPDGGPRVLQLAELPSRCDACRACPIGAGATQAVVGTGPAGAAHMLVGEQPGDQEDLAGLPFVGPAGRLLGEAMASLGWPRDQVYVTNAVKHFKYELRGKRRIHKTPAQREAAACLDWLEQEIALVQPRALVALGATAARSLLGRSVGIHAERGRWLHERADGRPVLVTFHPSALLRADAPDRAEQEALWRADLALARQGP